MNRYLQSGPMFRTQDRHSSEPAPEQPSHQPEVDLLVDLARVSRVTVLYGDEPSAKERVVRATVGMLERTAPVHAHTEIVLLFDTWDTPPLPALHARLLEAVAAKAPVEASEFATRPLADSLAAWQKVLDLRFIIILDYFERYLDLPSGRTGTAAFDAELTRIINEPGLRANFIIALEKSAEPVLLARYRKRIRRFADSSVRLGAVRDPIMTPGADDAGARAQALAQLQEDGRAESALPQSLTRASAHGEAAVPSVELTEAGPSAVGAQPREERMPAEHLASSATAGEAVHPGSEFEAAPVPVPRPTVTRKVLRAGAIAAIPLALAAALVIFVWPQEPASSSKPPAAAALVAPDSIAVEPPATGPIALAEPTPAPSPAGRESDAASAPGATADAPALPSDSAPAAAPPAEAALPVQLSLAASAPPSAADAGAAPVAAPVEAAPAPLSASASAPPWAAPSMAPARPGAALSIYVRSEAQRSWAEQTIAALGPDAPRLIGINVVSLGPATGDLRYFRAEERAEAEALARTLEKAGFPSARVKEIPGFRARATPRHFEVWLAPAAQQP